MSTRKPLNFLFNLQRSQFTSFKQHHLFVSPHLTPFIRLSYCHLNHHRDFWFRKSLSKTSKPIGDSLSKETQKEKNLETEKSQKEESSDKNDDKQSEEASNKTDDKQNEEIIKKAQEIIQQLEFEKKYKKFGFQGGEISEDQLIGAIFLGFFFCFLYFEYKLSKYSQEFVEVLTEEATILQRILFFTPIGIFFDLYFYLFKSDDEDELVNQIEKAILKKREEKKE